MTSTIFMSDLALEAQQGGNLTVDTTDPVTIDVTKNVSILSSRNSSTIVTPGGALQWTSVVDTNSTGESVAADISGTLRPGNFATPLRH